ncbi:MAG: HAD-IIA family hydrolase [Bacteroidetes bacterium]|nr:HAD-IIA family hydrolase [Bacteroidota bacterium]
MINKYDAFIFDLDGTIYRGTKLIPGAKETVNQLKNLGKKLIFISNKTTGTVEQYFNFLIAHELSINICEIVNATTVLIKFLSEYSPDSNFFAIGEEVFINELQEAGFSFTNNPEEIEIVIVTLDRTLNYDKLEIAAKALELGARFFAANIDNTCPVDNGEILDAGSTISALEKRTHKKLEQHFGKPSKYMMDTINEKLQIPLNKCLIIGDRLETDIAMGNKFGIDTALVATGVKHFPNENSNIIPTYRINSVSDLIK